MARSDPRNRTRYWEDPDIAGLSCLHADFTDHDYAPHSHDGYVIAVTEAGGAEFTSRGAVGEATPAVLLAFNPDEAHSGRMGRSPRWCYRSIYLGEEAIAAVNGLLGIEAAPHFTANLFTDADLIGDFLRLHQALDRGGDTLRQRELLVASLGRLFRRHGSGRARISVAPRDRALLAPALELMHDRYAESLSLEDLSAAAGLTPFQLIALCKRETGLTPHAYLVQLRLKTAMDALREGVPIAEAAHVAGFYDQSALNRHLKHCFGVTPQQFARAGRSAHPVPALNFHQ
ncbi:MAG: AraC family transcriptional regulator [Alphaproteobacteria bacterium]|nr:AraC family transcriptional regulator [Alphaproteobacteria bacterium]